MTTKRSCMVLATMTTRSTHCTGRAHLEGWPMRRKRSILSVPAGNRHMIEKATTLPADLVLLDLEDAVVPELKAETRSDVIWALTELQWGERTAAYRCNSLETQYFYRDIIEIVEAAGRAVHTIVIP